MAGHSIPSPSSAEATSLCPGRVIFAAENKPNEAAAEGTAAHYLSEQFLSHGTPPEAAIGQVMAVDGFDIPVTSEMVKYVRAYTDAVSLVPGQRLIEQSFNLQDVIGFPMRGSADVVVINGALIEVIDLKFGRGVQVEAKENLQLALYAAGACREFDLVDDFKTVRMTIHQPRRNHIDVWEVSAVELSEFLAKHKGRLLRAHLIAQAKVKPEERDFNPSDKACQFCPGKGQCTALAAHVSATVFDKFEDLT